MKHIMTLLLISLLLFSACKKSEEAQEQVNEETDSTEEVSSEESVEDSASIFKQFAMKKSALSFQVEYDVSTTSGGKTMKTTMGQFVKGKQLRTDTTAEGVETRMYLDGDQINTCMNQGSWTCFSITPEKGQENKAYDESVKDIESNPEQYDIKKLPSRNIAGTTATCFRIVSEGTVDYCLSPEGVPLYTKSEGEGYKSEMTAKSYSLSVPSSAFELPAEPQDFSAIMGNFDPSQYQQ